MTDSFTVDASSLIVGNYTHTLRGTKDTSIVDMSINDISGVIRFPTSTTWVVDLILTTGTNEYSIKGKNSSDQWTGARKVTLDLPSFEPQPHAYFNEFDKHALLIGLRRNKGEKNWFFRTRLLSFAFADTGANASGLFQAVSHELGIKPEPFALFIEPGQDAMQNLVSTLIHVEIEATRIIVDAADMRVTRESHRLNPRTRTVDLDYEPLWPEVVTVHDADGNAVLRKRFEVFPDDKQIKFRDDELAGQWVTVDYDFRAETDHRQMTLGEIKTWLESITIGGYPLLNVSVSNASLPALGLEPTARSIITRDGIYIPHAMIRIIGLDNKKFQKSLLNRFGGAYGTELERFAKITLGKSSMGWDNLVLDEGMWDPDVDQNVPNIDFMPRLWDPVFGRWFCSNPSHDTAYNLLDYRRYNGYCPVHPDKPLLYRGVDLRLIHSGIGATDDLYATVVEATEEI